VDTYLTDLYKKQISLTEWFEAIGDPRANKLRAEDATKHDRLTILNDVIALPFGKPQRFSGTAVAQRSTALKAYIKVHGHELCAIRLIPKKPDIPKLRMRGYTAKKALDWFDEQPITPSDYDVDFVPHDNAVWATIFTVTDQGIYGEVKRGKPNQLTQGLYEDEPPISFSYNFSTWYFDRESSDAIAHIQEVVQKLLVTDTAKQKALHDKLKAMFAHNYLQGYFETSGSDEFGIWFIDYNRLLNDLYHPLQPTQKNNKSLVKGRTSSPGKITGTVRIVTDKDIATALEKDDILVCVMTTPDYLPLMQQAAGIITDLGGILSHAAIIARELKKPCITSTKNATQILKDGQRIVLDADNGTVFLA